MIFRIPLISTLDTLLSWDRSLFERINSGLASGWLDQVLPYVRNSVYWTPLYLFLLVFITLNFGIKGWWWVLFFLVTVSLTDMISSQGFKEWFHRLRPCRDPDMLGHIRLVLDQCAGGYSFTSSHAANHTGIAFFFYLTTRGFLGKWALIAFAWAALIGFAQIYVGVHYPIDILGGALIGMVFGSSTAWLFNKRFGFPIFDKEPTT